MIECVVYMSPDYKEIHCEGVVEQLLQQLKKLLLELTTNKPVTFKTTLDIAIKIGDYIVKTTNSRYFHVEPFANPFSTKEYTYFLTIY